jgi:hypothetical protein
MTTGVAWYGAVVATVSLVIAVYVAWRDRPRVVVYGVRGYRIPGSGAFSPDKQYITITITNRGRRPVTISAVYYRSRCDKSRTLLNDSIIVTPTELAEGRSNTYLLGYDLVDPSDIRHLVAVEDDGREWNGKVKG